MQQELATRQIEAAQMNELMGGVYGPGNPYSASLLNYQNSNREVNAMIQNPWHRYFSH
jgi:hypothetical protein